MRGYIGICFCMSRGLGVFFRQLDIEDSQIDNVIRLSRQWKRRWSYRHKGDQNAVYSNDFASDYHVALSFQISHSNLPSLKLW